MNMPKAVPFFIALPVALQVQPHSTALAQDVAAAARANRARAASANVQNEWYTPTRFSLRARDQNSAANVLLEITGAQDVKISFDDTEKGKQQTGEIMLVSGQRKWMLAKNLPLERGHEFDALGVPVLQLELAIELLRMAVPGGPSQIREKTPLDVHMDDISLSVRTVSASAVIEAPWTLQGTIEPIAGDQWSFDLTVKSKEAIHFSGVWQKEAAPPALGDDISLDGWQLLSIWPAATGDANGGILNYAAQTTTQHPKTLGELRQITEK